MMLRFRPVLGILLGVGALLASGGPSRGGHDHDSEGMAAHPHDPVLAIVHDAALDEDHRVEPADVHVPVAG